MANGISDAHRVFVKAATGTVTCPADSAVTTGCPVSSSTSQHPQWSSSSPACSSSSSSSTTDTTTTSGVNGCAAGCSSSSSSTASKHAARINMPVVGNTASVSQQSLLDTARQRSSIPMAASELPKHQQGAEADVWMYPSQQQFFNAMKRKGWDPKEQDMSQVVAIHNTVNERTWQHILAWEMLHACECSSPRLKRFQGKPNEYSPKARLLNFLGYKLPFDRHDWIVDRCGREVRYIIDFYSGAPQPGVPASMHLDVRPALDSVEAAWDRIRMQAGWVSSGRWLNSER